MRHIAYRIVLLAMVACLGATQSWQPTVDDLVALKHLALEHGAPIHRIAKSQSEMPPFDRIVFYPGDADPGWIWENRGETTSSGRDRAMNHALILAAMDSGVAGEQWKHYYDVLEAQDKAQSANSADPYRFRHAFLSELDAKLATLAPALPLATNDASLDEDASRITDQDLSLVIRGLFATPVTSKAGVLPAGMLARYDGKLGLGNYVIEYSSLIDDYRFYMDEEPAGSADASLGAYFQAIVDSGAAGQALKDRYAQASDKARLGLVLARAFDLENERTEAHSRAEIAWMRTSLRRGMSSKAVDALLATHRLTLRYARQSGTIEFPIRSNLACGTSIAVVVRFDQQQRVTAVEEEPPYTACM